MDDFLLFVAVGFAAQMVDGALGMAYGLTSTSVLLGIGVAPATASASVHVAEMVTTGVSGLSHWRFGNVDRHLFRSLVLPGMIGGGVGAYALASVPGDAVQPFVNAYLLIMGLVILRRSLRAQIVPVATPPKRLPALGVAGGFLDAVGGGGWGPMVASTLLGRGTKARYAVGSVNAAEFFVSATISFTFLFTVGLMPWPIIGGLIVGGAVAAPFAAYVVGRLPDRPLMILVGVLIILLAVRGLVRSFF